MGGGALISNQGIILKKGFKMRQDLKYRDYAKSIGYRERLHSSDKLNGRLRVPHNTISFEKGNKRVWFCIKGWACADFIGDKWTNHRYYEDLKEALDEISKAEGEQ